MNILEVVGICGGGLGRHIRGLCQALTAQGHSVTVVFAPHDVDPAFEQFVTDRRNKVRCVPLSIRREISPMADLSIASKLRRLIELEGPFDVIHGHSAKGGAIARIVGRMSGVPTVYTPNSLVMSSPGTSMVENAAYTIIERILGHWATSKMIAVSEGEREFILKLKLIPQERIVLIRNGINIQDFVLSRETTYEHIDQNPLTFGSVMRFSPQKAPGNLVQAFIDASNAAPKMPMRLVIAGDGELFPEVTRQVETSGSRDKISLLRWRQDIGEVLREFDIFVSPSLYEGLSYTVMEAMAAKLPVISTNVFGTKETVSQIPGNAVIPVGDIGALAHSIKQMATLTDRGSLRQLLRKIGQANYNHIRIHFRESETTRRTLDVYQALCSEVNVHC
jgi:glycosyltransferase involved in cell wall biosynthesis